jgi:hypothetical protein
MTDEEALKKARSIVGKFDMRLRERGASAYTQMQAMIQAALIEASMKGLSSDQMRERLRQAIDCAGNQKAFAEKVGVSAQYVCDCLQGRREIGRSIAAPLGYQPVTVYVPIESMVRGERIELPT